VLAFGRSIDCRELLNREAKSDDLRGFRTASWPPSATLLECVNVVAGFGFRRPCRYLRLSDSNAVYRLVGTHVFIVLRILSPAKSKFARSAQSVVHVNDTPVVAAVEAIHRNDCCVFVTDLAHSDEATTTSPHPTRNCHGRSHEKVSSIAIHASEDTTTMGTFEISG